MSGSPHTHGLGPWYVLIELHTLPSGSRELASSGQPPVAPSAYTLQSAKALGCRTAVLTFDESAYGAAFSDLVDCWITVDTGSVSACLAAIRGLDGPVVAVSSSIDSFIGIGAQVAAQLGLRGADTAGAGIARDKSAARAALKAAGVPDVRWAVASIDASLVTSPIGYPCVAKPIDGAGGWDVRLLDSDQDLRELCASHLGREYGRGVVPRRRLIFEEFVPGPLISCEGFVDGDEVAIFGYSDRVLGPLPEFVEVAVRFAATSPDARIEAFVHRCLRALAYDFGAFHLELVVGPDGPRLVELNARLVGAGVQHAIRAVSSAPISDYCVGTTLARRPPLPSIVGAAVHLLLFAPRSGVLVEISGLEHAAQVRGCLSAGALAAVGDHVRSHASSNSDSVGFVHAVGETREEAYAVAVSAASRIGFEIEPL